MAAVQIKGPQSSWVSTDNIAGAYWQVPNAPAPPLDVRVQDSNGGQVCLNEPALSLQSKLMMVEASSTEAEVKEPMSDTL